MRHSNISFIIAAACTLLLASCEKERQQESNESNTVKFDISVASSEPVSRTIGTVEDVIPLDLSDAAGAVQMQLLSESSPVWFKDEVPTRGSMVEYDQFNTNGTFSLFTIEDGEPAGNNLKYYATSGVWTSAAKKQWPGDDRVIDFYAVAPYNQERTFASRSFTYSPSVDYAAQEDLMVARHTGVMGNFYDQVSLVFYHCLSAVRFKTSSQLDAEIKSITISGVHSSGTMTVGSSLSASCTPSGATSSYKYTPAESVSATDTYITGTDQAFLMIPQTTPSGSNVKAECIIGGNVIEVSANLAGIQWKPGYTYTYTITPKVNGLYFEFEDEVDENIFTKAWLPASHAGESGYIDYPSVTPKDGFQLVGWFDKDGNQWTDNGGKFSRQVGANEAVYLHPKFTKTGNRHYVDAGAVFNATLRNFVTANSDTEIIFGNWSTYSTTVGGNFNSSTAKVGYGKYDLDEIRLFSKGDVTYVLANGSHYIDLNPDSGSAFSGLTNVTRIDLRNTSSAEVVKMSNMFSGCNNLATIMVDTGWNTSSVTDGGTHMFSSCGRLVGDWGTRVSGDNVANAKPDSVTQDGCLSTTDIKHYVLNKDAAHTWVKAALNAYATEIHFGPFDRFKGGDGKVGGRTWAENVAAQGLGYSSMYFNTTGGTHSHGNPCFNADYHHIADFFCNTVDGWVLSEGSSQMVLVGDYSGFLQGAPYNTQMHSIEFVNVDVSRATNFPFLANVRE